MFGGIHCLLNIAGYKLCRGVDETHYDDCLVIGYTNNSYTFTGMMYGKTYYFILQSFDADGNFSAIAGPVSEKAP
jgi:hypothetical protein